VDVENDEHVYGKLSTLFQTMTGTSIVISAWSLKVTVTICSPHYSVNLKNHSCSALHHPFFHQFLIRSSIQAKPRYWWKKCPRGSGQYAQFDIEKSFKMLRKQKRKVMRRRLWEAGVFLCKQKSLKGQKFCGSNKVSLESHRPSNKQWKTKYSASSLGAFQLWFHPYASSKQ